MFPTALIFWPHGKLLRKLNFVTDDLVAERFIRTLKENLLVEKISIPSRSCDPLDRVARHSTKLGSSPATVIVPQPKCGPIDIGLIRTPWSI